MATISGKVIFDLDRSGNLTIGDSGLANVPVVLQDVNSNFRITALTDINGNYSFINVPSNANYRIVEVYGETGGTNPADFFGAVKGSVPVGKDPPIILATNPPTGATTLDSTTPNTVFKTVIASNIIDVFFFDAPIIYTPIDTILDPCSIVNSSNLISTADNGTFGIEPAGSPPNSGPAIEPYPGISSGFSYLPPTTPTVDGAYTILNILNPFPFYRWWILANHTTGDETGRFQLINGDYKGKAFFQQIVSVTPNTNYLFTTWIANLINVLGLVEPSLGVLILDQNNNILYNQTLGNSIPANDILPEWKQIGTLINSGNNTNLTVIFISEGEASINGNDYAIDDVKFQKINVPVFTPVKSVNKSFADVGEVVTYTVKLTNSCQTPLTSVFFKDTIPSELEFISGTVTGGSDSINDNPNTGFNVPNINGNSTTTITFKVKVLSIPDINPVNNTATMNYSYTPVEGGIPNTFTQNTNTVPITINNATLNIVKSVDKESAVIGDIITYTLSINYTGNQTTYNVVINDPIPNGTLYVPGSLTVSRPYTGDPTTTVTLTNSIAPGETISISFQVKVIKIPNPNPISNKATVTYAYTIDPANPNGVTATSTSNSVLTLVFKYNFSKQITDTIASIALEEAALSSIINSEGAKIQTMVAMNLVTTHDLLCLNKSVSDMIDSITILNFIFKQKLNTINCQINPPCI